MPVHMRQQSETYANNSPWLQVVMSFLMLQGVCSLPHGTMQNVAAGADVHNSIAHAV